jgi:hypothetical protein
MMKRKILTITLSLILLLTFAPSAFAQGPGGAQVVFGDNFELEDGQTLDRDLVVFGGNVEIGPSSTVTGDLIVFGGRVNIDGTVDGDMGVIGGNVILGETAVVEGDIGLVGGHADIADGAVVEGNVESITQFDYEYDWPHHGDDDQFDRPVPPVPPVPDFPDSFDWPDPFRWMSRVVSDIFWAISLLVVMGLISWLVAAFMPEQMLGVRRVVSELAPLSLGLGFVTSILAVVVGFLLILTICLAFVPIIAYIILGIAALFGWIVIGQILGERLLVASGRTQPGFIFSSIVGVSVLTLLTNMPVIGQVPCLGFLLSLMGGFVGIVVTLTGMGAVLLTRFGTRPYPAPTYSYTGGRGPSSAPSMGTRVRWTDPTPEVSEEEPFSSEDELNAKIKAALAEADQVPPPMEEKPAQDEPTTEEPPTDEESPVEEKPKKPKPRPEKPDDEPQEEPEPEA